jgi:predicted ATPase
VQIVVNSTHKSIPRGLSFEIPNFCILTGRNGSGKSHLLEAIAGRSAAKVFNNGVELTAIHHVGFNGLNPQVDEQCDSSQVIGNLNGVWGQIQGLINQYQQEINRGQTFQNVVTEYLPRHGQNPWLHSIISRLLTLSGKSFEKLTQNDLFQHINFVDITQGQLFFSQCALIFKGYHTRQIKNEFAQFRANKDTALSIPFLSTQEFLAKYGPPPWELVNEILMRAELPYEFTSPDMEDFELPYRLRLVDKKKSVDIAVNDLSSGEKVLMSLALAIYNTQEGGSRPQLLLLDEPDAPLHPHFSKLLIDTIIETIIKKAGVNVVITTHSPSTVAMAPEGSVFEIDRDSKTPRMVSNSFAIQILTEGINFLKISYEKRKQIFVESKYDVEYLQRLQNLLNRKYPFEYQPVFLEPHSGTSNCQDVISIVEKLRSSGSDLAYGIIDFDLKNQSSDTIFVLGGGVRYAIENYILDPLYVTLALIRYGKKSFSDFGVIGKNVYTDAASLSQSECQLMIENFLISIGIAINDVLQITLENGFTINYPKEFLNHNGHGYENKLKTSIPELNAISKGQGDSALKLGLLQVIEEFPQYLPVELATTFKAVLA